jgi:E-phenylitaconyl-CoA hydratase
MSELVLYEKRNHTSFITINRPDKMNALSSEVAHLLSEAWLEFRGDSDAWTAVLTGNGPAFCAGGDLKEALENAKNPQANTTPKIPGVRPGSSYSEFTVANGLWKPIIAAVNGHCMAGGFGMALNCDIRIASENARFGASEIRWSHMAGGQNYILPRIVPLGWAFWLLFSGQTIDAQTAYNIGLVQEITTREGLLDAATRLADTINANGPLVAQHTKEFTYRSLDLPLSSSRFFEGMFYGHLRQSPDYDEGTASFVEKRDPKFFGKSDSG